MGVQREETLGAGDEGSPGCSPALLGGQLAADAAVEGAADGTTLVEHKALSSLDTGEVVPPEAGLVAAGDEVPLHRLAEEALSGRHSALGADKGRGGEVGDPETPTVELCGALGAGDEVLAVFIANGALPFLQDHSRLHSWRLFR